MNELIGLSQTEIGGDPVETVNARDLHRFLEVQTAFKDWITRRIDEYGFSEGEDFCSFLSESSGGRPAKEYAITLDMAKELSMVERNDKGKQARQYFIECERTAKQLPALNDPAWLRGTLLDYTERVIAMESQIEEDKPKVTFYEQFMDADGLYGLQNAARALGYLPNLFIRWLKQKYLFYQGSSLVPRITYIQMGIFELRNNIVDDRAFPQTYLTPRGIEYFAERAPEKLLAKAA